MKFQSIRMASNDWMIFICIKDIEQTEENKVPDDLMQILKFAKQNGCQWVDIQEGLGLTANEFPLDLN